MPKVKEPLLESISTPPGIHTLGGKEARTNLVLATVAFTLSFALWGLLSGLAPLFKANYSLSATQTSLMVAIPVLLGSLGRIPAGLLTDRFGGRLVFSVLLIFGTIPAVALALNHSYASLLVWGFWLGLAGSSFAIGVAFVSGWFPPQKQGTALGIYGVGNIGQSIAVFGGPFLTMILGIQKTFVLFGAASLFWGSIFALCARNAPRHTQKNTLCENLRVLVRERMAWVLSLFYFLTFGGFVALGIYTPTLLRDLFQLSPADAGARVAFLIVLATGARPLGGWLADRVGAERVLYAVFVGITFFSLLMIPLSIYPFTVGALGCAALMGLGNGAVFKLVPQCFPAQTGTVTGLVGASGGLGGFFPPIVLGLFRDLFGSYGPGFLLLSAFAFLCVLILRRS